MPASKKQAQKTKKVQSNNGHNVTIPLVRFLPPDLVSHFADNTLVTHTENEFAISFLQSQYPLAASKEELQQIDQMITKCIVRIIVTPKHMEQMVEVLQRNLEKYKETYKKTKGE